MTERLSEPKQEKQSSLALAMEAVLRTEQGRELMVWILQRAKVFDAVYTADPNTTAFHLGERNIGLQLMALMNEVGPETYPTLLIRANREKQEKEVVYADEAELDADPDDVA